MSIRKIIREQLEDMIGSDNTVKGIDILNHFPFSELPETRDDVDWSNRGIKGWGDVHIPSLDANGLTQMFGKDDVIGYVNNFNKKFGEDPIFKLNSSAPWHSKTIIINEPYIQAKDLTDKAIMSFGTKGD